MAADDFVRLAMLSDDATALIKAAGVMSFLRGVFKRKKSDSPPSRPEFHKRVWEALKRHKGAIGGAAGGAGAALLLAYLLSKRKNRDSETL